MKGRESGMPQEAYWSSFFDPNCLVRRLGCEESRVGLVEFGCGYGTFTAAAAMVVKGPVFALDIDPDMVAATESKVRAAGLSNVPVSLRDFVGGGTGLEAGSTDHAMLYNILHIEDPVRLLREAHRVLVPGGLVSIIHWRSDIATPRGPSLEIRPRPEQCLAWGEEAGLRLVRHEPLPCCPFHYGLVLARP